MSFFGYGTQIMNGVLTPDVSTSPAFSEVAWWPTDGLRRRLALLEQTTAGGRDEVAELRREKAQLKQEAGYWKSMHARAVEREAKLAAELETARGEIRKLQDRLFGRKSERDSCRDRSNQLQDPQTPDAGKP